MAHPENQHRLWLSKETQDLCGITGSDHAQNILSDLGSSHVAAHPDPADTRLCVYVSFTHSAHSSTSHPPGDALIRDV